MDLDFTGSKVAPATILEASNGCDDRSQSANVWHVCKLSSAHISRITSIDLLGSCMIPEPSAGKMSGDATLRVIRNL